MYIYIYTYVDICKYTNIYICIFNLMLIYIYISMSISIFIFIFIFIFIHMYVQVYVYAYILQKNNPAHTMYIFNIMYICIYTYTYSYSYSCSYICKCECTYMKIHTCAYIFVQTCCLFRCHLAQSKLLCTGNLVHWWPTNWSDRVWNKSARFEHGLNTVWRQASANQAKLLVVEILQQNWHKVKRCETVWNGVKLSDVIKNCFDIKVSLKAVCVYTSIHAHIEHVCVHTYIYRCIFCFDVYIYIHIYTYNIYIYILCLAHSLGFQASTMSKHCLVSPLCLSWRCLLWLLCADLARKHKNWARWALRVVHGINRLDSTYIRGHIVLIRLFHIFLCFKRMRESIFQESATNFHPWCKVKWTLFRRFSERKTVWRFTCQLKSPLRFAPILRRWGHKKISAWCPRFWKGRNTFNINTGRSRSINLVDCPGRVVVHLVSVVYIRESIRVLLMLFTFLHISSHLKLPHVPTFEDLSSTTKELWCVAFPCCNEWCRSEFVRSLYMRFQVGNGSTHHAESSNSAVHMELGHGWFGWKLLFRLCWHFCSQM